MSASRFVSEAWRRSFFLSKKEPNRKWHVWHTYADGASESEASVEGSTGGSIGDRFLDLLLSDLSVEACLVSEVLGTGLDVLAGLLGLGLEVADLSGGVDGVGVEVSEDARAERHGE